MTNEIKDGGPAFPQVETTIHMSGNGEDGYTEMPDTHSFGGMTMRDYFAAKAIPALLHEAYASGECSDGVVKPVAKMAYVMADAMLKARGTP